MFLYQGEDVQWSVDALASQCEQPFFARSSIEALLATVGERAAPGDVILVMSNGGFGDFHGKLLAQLTTTFSE